MSGIEWLLVQDSYNTTTTYVYCGLLVSLYIRTWDTFAVVIFILLQYLQYLTMLIIAIVRHECNLDVFF